MLWVRSELVPDYEVSEYGDVRRVTPGPGARVGRILRPKINWYGYPEFVLRRGGRSVTITAYKLVVFAFIGHKPEWAEQIAHLDGNPKNNHYSNLKWVTTLENNQHMDLHGTRVVGVKSPHAKITEEDVTQIRKLALEYRLTQREIGDLFKLSQTHVGDIIRCEKWKHVNEIQ